MGEARRRVLRVAWPSAALHGLTTTSSACRASVGECASSTPDIAPTRPVEGVHAG